MKKLKNLLPAIAVYAQGDNNIHMDPVGDFSQIGNLTIPSIITGLIRLALVGVALIFFAMLIWGGFRWITSRGDKTAVEEARNQITHALIGLAIIFAAWAIIKLIYTLFGVNILELEIPSLQPN